MANPTVRVGFLGDASQLAREARRAQESLDGVSRHAHTTSTALGTALGTVAGRGIGAIAGAARHAVGSISELASTSIEAAGAMEESIRKSDRVFGTSADVVAAWAADSSKNILLTKQAAIEGASGIGNLITSWGVAQPEAAKMSTSLVGLAQDLSSFAHISQDDAFTALRSGLAGQARGLRQYGVDLSATRVQAEAYALGLAKPVKNAHAIEAANVAVSAATQHLAEVQAKHGKGTLAAAQAQTQLTAANDRLHKALAGQTTALTAAQTVQARYSLILKGTTTIQGAAKRNQDGYAESTRILHKNIGDLEVTIGQKLLPYALQLTHSISDLVKGFDDGTGAGGRLRDDLANLGQTAKGIGDDLKPMLGVVQWFADHPDALKGAIEGMVAYRIATKSAALWSERLAAANVADKITAVGAVAPGAAGAVSGLAGALAGLTLVDIAGWGAAAYDVFNTLRAVVQGLQGDIGPLTRLTPNGGFRPKLSDAEVNKAVAAMSPKKRAQFYKDYPQDAPASLSGPYQRHDPQVPDDYAAKNHATLAQKSAAASSRSNQALTQAAQRTADAQKAATDKVMAGQKYAADQADAAAKAKSDAADALQKATQKLQDALQNRLDTAKGIRDSLISSNSIVRDGVSFTAKDLLARFTVTMGKVKRFQTALSSLVHKGFDPEIVQQVAAAGVQGGLGTAVGLAHATAGQVRQINATQAAIDKAAGFAGDRVASQIVVKIDNKLLIGNKELQLLATEVRRQTVSGSRNGSLLAS